MMSWKCRRRLMTDATMRTNAKFPEGVWHGVSKGVEVCLWTGDPSCKAVSRVACSQGVEGLGMAGPSDTLGSPWPPLSMRP
jgi:hypothetical protein